ncbi:MAG: hypothetical protein ACTSVV_18005 [Promethearchaeota archaeon]
MITQEQLRPLIIDFGSCNFRLGWGGEDFPEIIAPSIYADISDYLFESDVIEGLEDIFIKDKQIERFLFGHDALRYQNILNIHEFRKEKNYNVMMKFFLNYYERLGIAEENKFKQPIIFLTSSVITDLEKSKIQHIFLNRLNFPTILFLPENQAIISTLQKTTGVIVNMGESNTTISSIFRGFSNIMAQDVFPVAGKELTDYLLNLIVIKRGLGKSYLIDKWIVKDIKEKSSLCVLNPDEEARRVKEGFRKYDLTINLPNTSTIELNMERFLVAEPLFNPKIIHIDYIGLGEAIANVIKSWDRENWEHMLSSIILTGGTSLIPNLDKRLKIEVAKHFSSKLKDVIKIIAASGRENMAWIGASILYSKNKLSKNWVNNPNLEKNEILEPNNNSDLKNQ